MDHIPVNTSQYGFLQKKSRAAGMADGLGTITKTANAGKTATVVYLDKTKAFDRVLHSRLIN